MNALVLTGRVVPGRDRDDAIAKAAALFGLDAAQFATRVIDRTPVTIRETPDPSEIQKLRVRLLECGLDAEVATSDGVKWQLESEGATRGPVPLSYLDAEYRLGRLSADQRVKRSTDSAWMPIASATAGDTATHVRLSRPAGVTAPSVPPPVPNVAAAPPPLPRGTEPPPLPGAAREPLLVNSPSAVPAGASLLDRTEAMKIFVGPNYEYFATKWQSNGGRSWNWAAFFLGPIWLMYRKMYLYTMLYIVFIVADIAVEDFFNVNDAASNFITLVIGVLFAWNANAFYRQQFERKLFSVSQHPSADSAKFDLARQGGTSLPTAIVFALIVVALIVGGALVAAQSG